MRWAPAVRAAALGLGLLLAAAAIGGCGEDDQSGAQPPTTTTAPTPATAGEIELEVVYDDGAGTKQTGELTCRDGQPRATGALFDGHPAAQLCARARAIGDLLTTQPDVRRVCTQVYGGPETAHVTGTLDGKPVDRRFNQTNGCEVAEFVHAAGLLRP